MSKIIQCTTVHPRTDTRIRVKILHSLAEAFPQSNVSLYVQDGLGDEVDEKFGAQICDTGKPETTRLRRMLKGSWRMYRALRAAKPAVVHFHDPELILIGLLLRMRGIKVVQDVHEDLPQQVLSKSYIPKPIRHLISVFVRGIEWISGQCMSGVVAATETIGERFPARKTICIQNFPVISEFSTPALEPKNPAECNLVYIGGITKIRGIVEMLEALDLVRNEKLQLHLAGMFQPATLEAEISALPSWKKVSFKGWLQRDEVAEILNASHVGLTLLHPTQAYLDSLPVKMFEYMASGLPVILSDFPLWRSIVEPVQCGVLVDPQDPQAIADAMDWIAEHPEEARLMGERGREAVQARYNWGCEVPKLVSFYEEKLKVGASKQTGSNRKNITP